MNLYIDGVAIESPLSLVAANFYIEKFEQTALESASSQPQYWFCYVSNTFMVWIKESYWGRTHAITAVITFLTPLFSDHPTIQFTMKEKADSCPSLICW